MDVSTYQIPRQAGPYDYRPSSRRTPSARAVLVAMAVLVLVAGTTVLGVYGYLTRQELGRERVAVATATAERDRTVQRLTETENDLAAARERLTATNNTLQDTTEDLARVSANRKDLFDCLGGYIYTVDGLTEGDLDRALDAMAEVEPQCDRGFTGYATAPANDSTGI